jgi:hypothetical protein
MMSFAPLAFNSAMILATAGAARFHSCPGNEIRELLRGV